MWTRSTALCAVNQKEADEMCEYCHQTPCEPRCPNASDEYSPYYCPICGEEVENGVYKLDDEIIGCDQCIKFVPVENIETEDSDDDFEG